MRVCLLLPFESCVGSTDGICQLHPEIGANLKINETGEQEARKEEMQIYPLFARQKSGPTPELNGPGKKTMRNQVCALSRTHRAAAASPLFTQGGLEFGGTF